MTRSLSRSLAAVLALAIVFFPTTVIFAASGGGASGQERAEAAGKGLIGSPAPRMMLKTIDGQSIDLAPWKGA
jgi:hypothetical protein